MIGSTASPVASLAMLMRALKLPAFARYNEEIAQKAEREGWTFGQFSTHLAGPHEVHERRRRRIDNHPKDLTSPARRPGDAHPIAPAAQGGEDPADALRRGLRRARRQRSCVRAAGPRQDSPWWAPGREPIQRGHRVVFTPTFAPRPAPARRQARPATGEGARHARRVRRGDPDDIGYVQQSREEMEVLFTFLAERYECRSVIITSNVVPRRVGSDLSRTSMTTVAAIDRLVRTTR